MNRIFLIAALVVSSTPAFADGPSKEVCIESHSKGQDARDQGKLSLARKLFLTCAQTSCPALVQGDCARFTDDLTRLQPTVGFVARDSNGVDLPDTTVYVDELLLTTRLDDGKQHDIDPGKHSVKFVHDGKEQVQTIVVGAGEKGRSVSATFSAPAPTTPASTTAAVEPKPATAKPDGPKVIRPSGAKILIIAGAALVVGGGALATYGFLKLPDACSVGSYECAAPPGDPVFDDAKSAMQLADIGMIAGGIGVVTAIGGLVWYYRGATTQKERDDKVVTPWMVPGGGGIALSGHL